MVKNIDSLVDSPLPRNTAVPSNVGSVRCLQCSPSGSIIVAAVDGLKSDEYYLIVWNRLTNFPGVCWTCVAAANVRAPLDCTVQGVSLAWANILGEEWLILSTLLVSKEDRSTNDSKLMVSVVGSDRLISGKLLESILINTSFYPVFRSRTDILNGSVCIQNFPLSLSENNLSSIERIGLLIWIGSRLFLFEVVEDKSKFRCSLCWTDVSLDIVPHRLNVNLLSLRITGRLDQ